MIPDNVDEALAVIYGEQPPQTPATPEPETTPEPEPEPEIQLLGGVAYRVQPGDTPQSIALAHYGDTVHAAAILAANHALGILIADNLTVNALILLP